MMMCRGHTVHGREGLAGDGSGRALEGRGGLGGYGLRGRLGLGRLANFVNGELFGRATDVPWAVIFPRGGNIPRHPSELYEAALEGLALFIIMALLARNPKIRAKHGLLSGVFLALYGLFRFAVEFFREPDPQLGFLFAGATMGQLLCLPMIAFGVFLMLRRAKGA